MKSKAIRCIEKQRLVYLDARADPKYWDQHWESMLTPNHFRRALKGITGCCEEPFIKYLPKNGRILEAGCGCGQNVLALRKRGYDISGVDNAEVTIRAIQKLFPGLPIEPPEM